VSGVPGVLADDLDDPEPDVSGQVVVTQVRGDDGIGESPLGEPPFETHVRIDVLQFLEVGLRIGFTVVDELHSGAGNPVHQVDPFHLGQMPHQTEKRQVGRRNRAGSELFGIEAGTLALQRIAVGIQPTLKHSALGEILVRLRESGRGIHGAIQPDPRSRRHDGGHLAADWTGKFGNSVDPGIGISLLVPE